jgi:hypothetical protein
LATPDDVPKSVPSTAVCRIDARKEVLPPGQKMLAGGHDRAHES